MMRKAIPFILFLTAIAATAQPVNNGHDAAGLMVPPPIQEKNPAFIQLSEEKFNFDTIEQDVPVTHAFVLKNVGDRDIELLSVNASCGCTTPNWRGGKYKPQDSTLIKATYNAKSMGFFHKVITVVTSEGTQNLVLTGYVMPKMTYQAYVLRKNHRDSLQRIEDAKRAKIEAKLQKKRDKLKKK